MKVIIALRADDEADIPALALSLREMKAVEEALELSGGLDIMLKLRSDSVSELNALIERIKSTRGVKSAESYLVIGESR